jgi:hypothetical protein
MSFMRKNLTLNGSQPHLHPMRKCDKCEKLKAPEGGIQMSPSKWHCAECWTRKAVVKK